MSRVVLIAGASGGIGRAIAQRFAQAGDRLVLADLRSESLELAPPGADSPPRTIVGDLSDEQVVGELFDEILRDFGRLDVMVNAAGLLRNTPLGQIKKSEWDAVLNANLGVAFLLSRGCVEPMRRQRSGRIVHIASLAGQVGGIRSGAHYAAAKAGVISLTRSMSRLLAPHGVTCNALAPSGVETEMLAQFVEADRAALLEGIPAGRFGTPAEIAAAIFWICSDEAAYLTGQCLNLNGGAYMG